MDKLRFQAKAIRDAAIAELLRQIRYKADWYGTVIVEASRSFPPSKTCHRCNTVNQQLKREKHWEMPNLRSPARKKRKRALNLLKLALN